LHESKIYPIRVDTQSDLTLERFIVKENNERLAMFRSTFFSKPGKERKRLSIHNVTTMHNSSVTLPVDHNWIHPLGEGVQQPTPSALPQMTTRAFARLIGLIWISKRWLSIVKMHSCYMLYMESRNLLTSWLRLWPLHCGIIVLYKCGF
jgi:hypothetical protein